MTSLAISPVPSKRLGLVSGTGSLHHERHGPFGWVLRHIARLPNEKVSMVEFNIDTVAGDGEVWHRRFGRRRRWSSEVRWDHDGNLIERFGFVTLVFRPVGERLLWLEAARIGPVPIGQRCLAIRVETAAVGSADTSSGATTTVEVELVGGRLGALTYTAEITKGIRP